jgi:uncharacterized protein YegL
MRRLPVYLILDTSGSMSGEPIEEVTNGVQMLVTTLRSDPYALETVYLSFITFDSEARQVVPLTELPAIQIPGLHASGETSLGGALTLVADKIDKEVKKTTPTEKGDWKPLVFIYTDGVPTDEWEQGLELFKKCKCGIVVACAAGNGANVDVLKKITDNVVGLDTSDSNSIRAFFKWVTASVSSGSQKIETGGQVSGMSELPPPPPEVNIII